jgi:hypothetical protein
MEIINHKIGESFTFITEDTRAKSYRVFRSYDGKFFNRERKLFEVWEDVNKNTYIFPLFPHTVPGLQLSRVNYIPKTQQDLIFEILAEDNTVLYRERHLFGGLYDEAKPNLCIIYGTLYDPSGHPVINTKIEASLNKKGYFIDKIPVMGPVATALTDDRGYFELALIQGINVTINIPAIGFVTSGYVPKTSSSQLSTYCLLREGYGTI